MRKSTTNLLVLLYALLFTEGIGGVQLQQNGESKISCNLSELIALIKFKESLIDNSNRLLSWVGEDFCTWKGVGCSKGTGTVVELDLRNPILFDSDRYNSDNNYTAKYDADRLQGEINPSILNLKHLHHIDLSCNNFSGMYLNLSESFFQGPLPTEIGNASKLTVLDLSDNELEGEIPPTIRNLCNLSALDLSYNKFNGELPILIENTSGCLSDSLKDLRLGSNSIPLSIGQLSKLEYLDMSNNFLYGSVYELHFANLTRLNTLYLSLNLLVFDVSPQWVPPFQLRNIDLESIQLGPQFPPWLQTQRHLEYLGLRNTCISSTIPYWFGDLYSHIEVLDISQNQISGKLPRFSNSKINGTRRRLYLNSNKFGSPLISVPSDVAILDISNNLLSGSIPLINGSINMTLEHIDLSTNNLTGGGLPWCIGDLHRLEVLDLSNNNLHGEIPTSLGSLRSLLSLHLSSNRFHGKIPLSLCNLTNLQHLDLSENEFADIIPPWIGEKPSSLKFLSLQSNKFYGDISLHLCHLSSLQLLNLARNSITGCIPRCFGNISPMIKDRSTWTTNYYKESILAYTKGRELEYTQSRALELLTSIDLSNNHIVGEIPGELMDLVGLRY
ncbi:receptor-like protein Cf-9 homolog [Cornus florida]|uniref:receptor-like protein Cf-9 homolog n=1 Tax=Cornus florida TaxID=4283 RepID=UPI00289645B5|nr:receptor-like protein Cf-9 homolog [Cornus florida]